MFGKGKLKEEIERLEKENKILKGEIGAWTAASHVRRDTVKQQADFIQKQNKVIAAFNVDREILNEIFVSAVEIMNSYNPITGKYHAKIFKGEATVEDMKRCSAIMQGIIKQRDEFDRMVQLFYNEERKKEIGDNFTISIVK